MKPRSAAELVTQKCVPCEGGIPTCTPEFITQQLRGLADWHLTDDGKRIGREWKFKNFVDSLSFLNRVGAVAEQEQHHPDLHLTSYRHVRIEIWTHAIDGLSENDFILAAKIDAAQ